MVKSWRRWLGIALPVTAAAGWVLFVPPPPHLLAALVNRFPTAVLSGSETDTGMTRVFKRSLQLYVGSALASYLAARIEARGESDETILLRIMERVRGVVLNQQQVPHAARTWSSLASGLGYCDQINGEAARVASHHFRRAQIYALYDTVRHSSPHSIGRVWSGARRDWLYFDASGDKPVIFSKGRSGAPAFVDARGHDIATRGRVAVELYSLPGWVMNEYRPSVAGHIAAALSERFSHPSMPAVEARNEGARTQSSSPAAPVPGPIPSAQAKNDPAPWAVDDGVFERVAAAYAAARLAHLLGGAPNRAAYLASAGDVTLHDTRAAEFGSAARVFAAAQ